MFYINSWKALSLAEDKKTHGKDKPDFTLQMIQMIKTESVAFVLTENTSSDHV